jgi:RNA polymerase sigma-70 factor, ECF subfamily
MGARLRAGQPGRGGRGRVRRCFTGTLHSLRRRLFGYACALSRRVEDAEDLYQDALVRAMAAPSVPRDGVAFRVWMFRLIRNLWIDRLRRESPQPG